MGAKRKIFISMLSIAFVILAVLATIAVAFALTQQNITTSLSIDYVAIDIDGSVSATYTFGGVETSMLTSDNKPELVFRAADKTNAGSLNMPENKFSFSSVNDNIVLKYTFKNTGDVDYTAIVNFAETDVASENMKLEYSLDGLSYSTTNYGLVVTNAKPREYYLKISIDDKAKNASFTGTFSWVLERYIPTEGEENVVLNTSSYMVNADSETYSATFNPESNLTANSTWYVPSSIGSQQITRIILDDTLPANTKLVVPKGITEVWVGNPDTYEEATCSGLVEVHLSETVTAAGKHAMYWFDGFVGCNNLARISVAPGNPNYKSVNNCVISGSSIVVGTIESVIPDDGSVTSISEGAFDGKNIKSLYIPKNITTVNEYYPYAFPANGCIIYCESSRSEASWYEETYEDETYIRVNGNDVFKFDYSAEAYAQDLAVGEALSAANPGFEYVGSILVGYTGNATSVTIPEGTTSMAPIFKNNKTIKSVTLPSTLTEVGSSAFSGCTGLTNITIPANAETIGGSAFSGCTGLTNVTFNENCNLKTIGNSAFYGCTGLTNITIPASVETIASNVFQKCSNLTSFTFAENSQLQSLGSSFISGTAVETLEIPKNISNLTALTFDGAATLKSVMVEEGCLNYHSSGNCIIETKTKKLLNGFSTSVIPNDGSVEIIGSGSFKNQTELTAIQIPASVIEIQSGSFEYCSNLTSFTFASSSKLKTISGSYVLSGTKVTTLMLPASLETIAGFAFDHAKELTTVDFEEGSVLKTIGADAFQTCSKLQTITIPASVKSIGGSAFSQTYNIKRVNISDINAWSQISFSSLANPATHARGLYLNGTLVTNLVLDNSVTKISSYAFKGCSTITSVTLPSGLQTIGSETFKGCTGITNLTLPSSLQTIGSSAFSDCKSMTITIPDDNMLTSIGKDAFNNCKLTTATYNNCTYILTASGKYSVLMKSNSTSITEISLHTDTNVVVADAFNNCSSLTKVNTTDVNIWAQISFSNSTANPLYYAKKLYENGALVTNINLNNTVTRIGDYAFYNLVTNEMVLTIPSSVTTIGAYAFNSCKGITKVEFNANSQLTTIGNDAFMHCSNLSEIVLPDTVETIGEWAFASTSIRNINIPAKVKSLEYATFYNCAQLTNVTFAENAQLTKIGNSVFGRCSKLVSLQILNTVNYIGTSILYEASPVVTFENTVGWTCTYTSSYDSNIKVVEINADDLADSEIALKYLKTTYSSYIWTRS